MFGDRFPSRIIFMGTHRNGPSDAGETIERFLPPPKPNDWVRRSINLGPDPLTYVSGPAGTGKTALLSQWFQDLVDQDLHPAWLTLGVKETEPDILRQSIADATTLVRDVATRSGRVLFVDQLDTVLTPTLDDLVRDLTLRDEPWQLVIAGRPELDSRLGWAEVDVRTVGFEELRFNDNETRELLRVAQPELSSLRCQRLIDRTDGWAFAAAMASRLARAAGDSWESIDSFGGLDRELCDYLDTEVLSGLSASDREFLLQISMLSEPTPALCAAVTGQDESAERLHRLGRLNAMLTPTGGGRFRWMKLPQESLTGYLERTDPDLLRRNRFRAQEWNLEHQNYAEALEYAAASDDRRGVAAITDAHGMDILTSGRVDDVLRCLSELPASTSESNGWIGIVGAAALWITSGWEAAAEIDDWLNTAAFASAQAEEGGNGPSTAAIDIARSAFLPLSPAARYDLVLRAKEAGSGLDSSWRALGDAVLGIAAYMDNEPRSAREALTNCLATQATCGGEPTWVTPLIAESAVATLALIEIDEGELVRAEGLIHTAGLNTTTEEPTGPMVLARSRLARHRDDKPEAFNLALEAAERSRSVEYQTMATIEAASLCYERGQTNEARELADRADTLIELAGAGCSYLTKRRGILAEQVKQRVDSSENAGLTERELDVLRMLESDLTRREIGERLFIGHNTVKTYIRRLYAKLDVSSRTAAVAQAKEFGWL